MRALIPIVKNDQAMDDLVQSGANICGLKHKVYDVRIIGQSKSYERALEIVQSNSGSEVSGSSMDDSQHSLASDDAVSEDESGKRHRKPPTRNQDYVTFSSDKDQTSKKSGKSSTCALEHLKKKKNPSSNGEKHSSPPVPTLGGSQSSESRFKRIRTEENSSDDEPAEESDIEDRPFEPIVSTLAASSSNGSTVGRVHSYYACRKILSDTDSSEGEKENEDFGHSQKRSKQKKSPSPPKQTSSTEQKGKTTKKKQAKDVRPLNEHNGGSDIDAESSMDGWETPRATSANKGDKDQTQVRRDANSRIDSDSDPDTSSIEVPVSAEMLDKVLQRIAVLEAQTRSQERDAAKPTPVKPDMLPIKSVEELRALEEVLATDHKMQHISLYLAHLAPSTTVREAVSHISSLLFEHEFSMRLNLRGSYSNATVQKCKLRDYSNVMKLVQVSAALIDDLADVNVKSVNSALARWLQLAKDRRGGRCARYRRQLRNFRERPGL